MQPFHLPKPKKIGVAHSAKKKKTIEEIEIWVGNYTTFKLVPDQTYKNNKTPMKFICHEGHEFFISWNDLSQGKGCGRCAGNTRKTLEEIDGWVQRNTTFTLMPGQVYKNSKSRLKLRCCNNHEFSIDWVHLQSGRGCTVCAGNAKKTIEEIGAWVKAHTTFTLRSTKYITKTKLHLSCEIGHEFRAHWNTLQQGRGCPQCRRKAETQLGNLLSKRHKVERQHHLICPKDIRKSGKVFVDFYLPEINTIVEYHGEQHYREVPHFHYDYSEFEAQQRRDQWVRDYCLEHQINYREVSYLEFNHKSFVLD